MSHTLCYNETMQELLRQLRACIKAVRTNGITKAQTERDYSISLRKENLRLRDEQMPTTIIRDVARGAPDVAELRFERDCAEAVYQANLEAINSIKLEIRILEGQITRDWGQAKNGL